MMRALTVPLWCSLVACGGENDPSCDGAAMVDLPLIADTYVDGSATAHGGEGSLLIGAANQGLFRFRLGPMLRAVDLKFVLTLVLATTADECGSGCGPCPAAAPGTGVTVRLVRSDWDESLATAALRDGATAWSMPGPSGADTVPLAATSATSNGSSVSISFNAIGLSLDPGWPADEISILVSPVNATSAVVRYASGSGCEPASAPTLVATCTASAL